MKMWNQEYRPARTDTGNPFCIGDCEAFIPGLVFECLYVSCTVVGTGKTTVRKGGMDLSFIDFTFQQERIFQ